MERGSGKTIWRVVAAGVRTSSQGSIGQSMQKPLQGVCVQSTRIVMINSTPSPPLRWVPPAPHTPARAHPRPCTLTPTPAHAHTHAHRHPSPRTPTFSPRPRTSTPIPAHPHVLPTPAHTHAHTRAHPRTPAHTHAHARAYPHPPHTRAHPHAPAHTCTRLAHPHPFLAPPPTPGTPAHTWHIRTRLAHPTLAWHTRPRLGALGTHNGRQRRGITQPLGSTPLPSTSSSQTGSAGTAAASKRSRSTQTAPHTTDYSPRTSALLGSVGVRGAPRRVKRVLTSARCKASRIHSLREAAVPLSATVRASKAALNAAPAAASALAVAAFRVDFARRRAALHPPPGGAPLCACGQKGAAFLARRPAHRCGQGHRVAQ